MVPMVSMVEVVSPPLRLLPATAVRFILIYCHTLMRCCRDDLLTNATNHAFLFISSVT
jgi:hypothetical protein